MGHSSKRRPNTIELFIKKISVTLRFTVNFIIFVGVCFLLVWFADIVTTWCVSHVSCEECCGIFRVWCNNCLTAEVFYHFIIFLHESYITYDPVTPLSSVCFGFSLCSAQQIILRTLFYAMYWMFLCLQSHSWNVSTFSCTINLLYSEIQSAADVKASE